MSSPDLASGPQRPDWINRIVERLKSHWRLKLCLGLALPVVLAPIYLALERYPLFPPRTFPMSPIDLAIRFSPDWVWIYDSHYLLLQLAWLARTREQIRRFAVGFVMIMVIGFSVFILMPVIGPRPTDIHPTGMYALLVASDLPLNSFPSLHVDDTPSRMSRCCGSMHCASAALNALPNADASNASTPRINAPKRGITASQLVLNLFLAAWVILIVYSTMATRQHYFADLPPGLLLGWLGHRVAWRSRTQASASTPEVVESA